MIVVTGVSLGNLTGVMNLKTWRDRHTFIIDALTHQIVIIKTEIKRDTHLRRGKDGLNILRSC